MAAAGLMPAEHVVDAGYTSADLLLGARARGITLLGPLLSGSPPQARSGGYTAEAFTIDWDHQQVTCPQGAASTVWCPCVPMGSVGNRVITTSGLNVRITRTMSESTCWRSHFVRVCW